MDPFPEINGDIDIVKNIINSGVDINKKYTNEHKTLLGYATRHGYIPIVKYLVESGAFIDILDFKGYTPLFLAIGYVDGIDRIELVRYLLDNGADPNHRLDAKYYMFDNWTVLHTAAFYCDIDIVKILVEHGAHVDSVDSEGYTPLFYAAQRNTIDMIQYLLDNGADKTHLNTGGQTAAACAIDSANRYANAEFIESYEPVPTKGVNC